MDADTIRRLVLADAELKAWALAGRDGDIARDARLAESVGVEFRLTSRGVNDIFGLVRGAAIMAALRAKATEGTPEGAIIAEMLSMMDIKTIGENQGVDLNHADAPTLMGLLVSVSIVTADEAAVVLSKARKSVQPSVQDVSLALRVYRPEGKIGKYSSSELQS